MIDHQIDEKMIFRGEVSDEAVEAAGLVALGGFPTLPHTYCFGCPSDPLDTQSRRSTRNRRLCPFPTRCSFGSEHWLGVEPEQRKCMNAPV